MRRLLLMPRTIIVATIANVSTPNVEATAAIAIIVAAVRSFAWLGSFEEGVGDTDAGEVAFVPDVEGFELEGVNVADEESKKDMEVGNEVALDTTVSDVVV